MGYNRRMLSDIKKSPSFQLLKEHPSFMDGFASLLDVNGEIMDKFRTSHTDEKADHDSIYSDWKAVGNDIHIAIDKHASRTNA